MFGHNDDQTTQQDSATPMPDAALTADEPTSATPISEAAGEYIPTAVPGQSPVTASPVTAPTVTPPAAETVVPTPVATPTVGDGDGLLSIKQQALQQLTPLIDHLEQTPEEKFRTTMMMIQASDNDALIKDAYDAALAITDEKTRAQALLDIVNEINYFTQQNNGNEA